MMTVLFGQMKSRVDPKVFTNPLHTSSCPDVVLTQIIKRNAAITCSTLPLACLGIAISIISQASCKTEAWLVLHKFLSALVRARANISQARD